MIAGYFQIRKSRHQPTWQGIPVRACPHRGRIDALHKAKQKAEDLATVLGDSVGKALTISEFRPNESRTYTESMYSSVRGVVASTKPEKIAVSAKVYVVFELK